MQGKQSIYKEKTFGSYPAVEEIQRRSAQQSKYTILK